MINKFSTFILMLLYKQNKIWQMIVNKINKVGLAQSNERILFAVWYNISYLFNSIFLFSIILL